MARLPQLLCACMLAGMLAVAHGMPQDPLDVPASFSHLAASSPLFSITQAGKRLVAVGQRGHILISDDDGRQWQQAVVPVSTDLTAVHFPTPAKGWAVGHDGVILHSTDGGRTWVKQLDGRQAAALILRYYEHHGRKDDPSVAGIMVEAERMLAEGPDQPFLNVWFEDEKTGYAIGAFNLILKTTDGGTSWAPISELVDNPNRYHLYGISASGDDCYIVGELGLLLRRDRASGRFIGLPSPYKGSYFGVLSRPGLAVIFGLRGNAFRSEDGGKSWQVIETRIQSSIHAGTILQDGRIVLASQGGNVLISEDDARTFKPVAGIAPLPISGIAPADGDRLVLAGYRGIQTAFLK